MKLTFVFVAIFGLMLSFTGYSQSQTSPDYGILMPRNEYGYAQWQVMGQKAKNLAAALGEGGAKLKFKNGVDSYALTNVHCYGKTSEDESTGKAVTEISHCTALDANRSSRKITLKNSTAIAQALADAYVAADYVMGGKFVYPAKALRCEVGTSSSSFSGLCTISGLTEL